MHRPPVLAVRRALPVFLIALAGAITGRFAGARIAAVFEGARAWLLPALAIAAVLLALLVAYAVLRRAARRSCAPPGKTGA